MNTIKTEKLDTRDFITTGISAAISLVIFLVIGGAAGTTLVGTAADTPIAVLFMSIAYMLLVSKVRRRGTFPIMGIISALSGLMAANVIGVIVSVVGWPMAKIVVSANHYKNRKVLIFAHVLGCTLHSAGYTPPTYLSNAQYLVDGQEISHLIGETFVVHLKMFTWPMFFITVALTVVTSFLGAVLSTRILKKHFEKVGLL